MDYNRFSKSVKSIKMTDEMKKRIINNTILESQSKKSNYMITIKRPVSVLVTIVLYFIFAIPVLYAAADPIYQIMYRVSPAIAQYFQLVQKSDQDNGIKMEVISSYIHDNTAEIYVALQDLTGNRIDETTDLYDSYYIHSAFDSSAYCERVGYDEETRTAIFMIRISRTDNKEIDGDKITFGVKKFLSQKSEYKDIEIPVDLMSVSQASKTQNVYLLGAGGKLDVDMDSFEVIIPNTPDKAFPIDGIDFTGMAFIKGKLHIQIGVKDISSNDNNGFFYLVDAAGNRIDEEGSYGFRDETSGSRIDYSEYVFSVTPEQLKECKLYGNFWTSGLLIEGNWKVTFEIE